MKTVRFRDGAGVVRHGLWADDRIEFGGRTYDPGSVDVLSPTEPSKIILVGRNHASKYEDGTREPPPNPRLIVVPPSAVTGHGTTISLPRESEYVSFGAELGVVIGTQCKHVDEVDAMDVVAGYTCVNDLSDNERTDVDPFKTSVKGFDNAKPIGPVLATPEEVPADPHIELRIDGATRQEGIATNLHFTIPEIIERLTGFMTLNRGDVLSMGSVSGIAELYRGDHVEVEIEGIGVLANDVAEE